MGPRIIKPTLCRRCGAVKNGPLCGECNEIRIRARKLLQEGLGIPEDWVKFLKDAEWYRKNRSRKCTRCGIVKPYMHESTVCLNCKDPRQ